MGGLLIVLSMIVPFLVLSRYTQAGLTVFFVTLACGRSASSTTSSRSGTGARSASPGRWKLLLLAGSRPAWAGR